MKKPLTRFQCILLTLLWASLCALVITTAPRIDGPTIVSILISGALVFIPIARSVKTWKNK
ncbi:hypothetical protein [uncultured Phocaeicola sp.]|uniref:hypothetical protein n=1 Tax=uncultured Phocaeicola sp. TaxID=990718 RepID=UPI0015AF989A|nr:hypothetical protein [uncultured Phocaeicola sp.]